MRGILRKVIAGFCYVEAGELVYECKPRGNMRRSGRNILAGDIVEISLLNDNKGVVEKVEERKNSLVRPPIANVDRMFIVSSFNTPAPNSLIIDRIIAIAESKNIEPIVIFNKSDMGDLSYWKEIYEKAGYKAFIVSAHDCETLNELKEFLFSGSGISVFTGNSGVGKSTLINALSGDLSLKTGDISDKLGRGRHTTRQAEIFHIGEGSVIDTAGFSSIDFSNDNVILSRELELYFREFADYIGECKFTGCAHLGEKGCRICALVEEGIISRNRYESYLQFYNEQKNLKEWNL